MAERNSLFLFRGLSEAELRDAMSTSVAGMGGSIDWDARPTPMSANLLTTHHIATHAAYIHRRGFDIAKRIGKSLDIVWMNLRIQEGALWDYSLYAGGNHVDSFSTWPEYWENDPDWIATQRGKPALLADLWRIDQIEIERYLQPWRIQKLLRTKLRTGKAYPTDNHEYGNIWQMTDFLRALGAHDPNFDQPQCIPRGLELQED